MKIIAALDSVFATQNADSSPYDFGPYNTEDEWLRDYHNQSQWPGGAKHMTGVTRVGGPDLEDHPDYDEMWNAGWRPSRTRDALVHPKGRVLTVGQSTSWSPQYPQGRKLNWFEQAMGEGPVYYRDHEKLTDALGATSWDGETSGLGDEKGIERDLRWLNEDKQRRAAE